MFGIIRNRNSDAIMPWTTTMHHFGWSCQFWQSMPTRIESLSESGVHMQWVFWKSKSNEKLQRNKAIQCIKCCFVISVPRKVLKDQFDASIEPDEPQQIDMDQNQDDLYDEDQFYRESEAIPPAPKLHRELATSDMPTSLSEPSSSVNPPLRSRDSNQLEGNLHSQHVSI